MSVDIKRGSFQAPRPAGRWIKWAYRTQGPVCTRDIIAVARLLVAGGVPADSPVHISGPELYVTYWQDEP